MGSEHQIKTADWASGQAKSTDASAGSDHAVPATKESGLGAFAKLLGSGIGAGAKGAASAGAEGKFHLGGGMFAALGYGGGIDSVDSTAGTDAADAKQAMGTMKQTQFELQKDRAEREKIARELSHPRNDVNMNRVKTADKQAKSVTDFIKG
jgi:hypothetical protein